MLRYDVILCAAPSIGIGLSCCRTFQQIQINSGGGASVDKYFPNVHWIVKILIRSRLWACLLGVKTMGRCNGKRQTDDKSYWPCLLGWCSSVKRFYESRSRSPPPHVWSGAMRFMLEMAYHLWWNHLYDFNCFGFKWCTLEYFHVDTLGSHPQKCVRRRACNHCKSLSLKVHISIGRKLGMWKSQNFIFYWREFYPCRIFCVYGKSFTISLCSMGFNKFSLGGEVQHQALSSKFSIGT